MSKKNITNNPIVQYTKITNSSINGNNKNCTQILNTSDGYSKHIKEEVESLEPIKSSVDIINFEANAVNGSKEVTSISSVSGATQITSNTDFSKILECGTIWNQMKQNALEEQRQNKKRIDTFVEEKLFKQLKFISSAKMMEFNSTKSIVCQKVCTALNILPQDQHDFWETYCRCVETSLNCARNDAVAAVKKTFFQGKKN